MPRCLESPEEPSRCRVILLRIAAETPCACRQCDGGVTANEKQCRRRFAESPSQAGHAKILRVEARKAMIKEGGSKRGRHNDTLIPSLPSPCVATGHSLPTRKMV